MKGPHPFGAGSKQGRTSQLDANDSDKVFDYQTKNASIACISRACLKHGLLGK
jgi:hypothetical protein